MSLQNKKILLIIGGGISAYKSLDLIRLLLRKKSSVKVVLTKSGKKFVTALSISSLLKNKVFEEVFENKKILLIICGGIAAYKSLELIRLF